MRSSLLLVAILMLLALQPFFSEGLLGRVVLEAIVLVLVIAAVWAVSRHPAVLTIVVLLAVPTLVIRLGSYVFHGHPLRSLWPLFAGALFAFTALVLLRQVLLDTEVTLETIAASVCVYLLLAVVWAFVYTLIESSHPGAFQVNGQPLAVSQDPSRAHVPELLYFSLVTISTVGYGDIVAMTQPARMLAALEGVIGQLYLAVLIARLIGMHVPSRSGHDG
jgi:hypothetical protein